MKKVRFSGLDVHADTIAVAVAEPDGEVRSLGMIANREESVRKLVKKLGPEEQLQACYEAGPTGYVLYRQLASQGVKCEVVAPAWCRSSLGTGSRPIDAMPASWRRATAGDLTTVWVPWRSRREPRNRCHLVLFSSMMPLGNRAVAQV